MLIRHDASGVDILPSSAARGDVMTLLLFVVVLVALLYRCCRPILVVMLLLLLLLFVVRGAVSPLFADNSYDAIVAISPFVVDRCLWCSFIIVVVHCSW